MPTMDSEPYSKQQSVAVRLAPLFDRMTAHMLPVVVKRRMVRFSRIRDMTPGAVSPAPEEMIQPFLIVQVALPVNLKM
jgi:hypothetical protein